MECPIFLQLLFFINHLHIEGKTFPFHQSLFEGFLRQINVNKNSCVMTK